ncbi:MAG: hypothetical protein KIT80_23035 [Chitinophagaceae bacterium]|nr:hypothetical protein [Chitinophagaceae bacterium]MCW5929814.1 hypothetical protein [Chitinophagaceae bacterium]
MKERIFHIFSSCTKFCKATIQFPLIIYCTLISYPLFSQNNPDSVIKRNHVKEVRILNLRNDISSIARYNTDGRITYNSLNDFAGATFLRTSSTRVNNEEGQTIKSISTHSSFPDSTIWIYQYDTNGNLISINTHEGKPVFKYYYDTSNFRIKEYLYNDSNKIDQTTTFEKVDNGKKIVSRITGNFIKNRTNTTYLDNNGNTIKSESYDSDKINYSAESIYENNRLMKTIYNSGYGSKYTYDSKGRLLKRINFQLEDGREKNTGFEEFKYNKKGLLINYKENIYSPGGIRKYRYEYAFY